MHPINIHPLLLAGFPLIDQIQHHTILRILAQRNYPDVFAVSDKRMVKRLDGTFALYSPEEVKELSKEGKITIEYPTTKNGQITDLTQKPVLVLNE